MCTPTRAEGEVIELNKIYNEDCLLTMSRMEDKSIDLIVTDPPYGIAITRKRNNYGTATHCSRINTNEEWDDDVPTAEVFAEIFRVSKNQIVFGANYFWGYFYATPCYIVWDKRGSLPSVPFAPTEFAWTSFDKQPKKYTVINHGFITDVDEKREHPTQKPLKLIAGIVSDFTDSTMTIYDPFLGSGTTAVACEKLGRRWIGSEINPDYCKIAEKRIREFRAQGNLFQSEGRL